jgi:hypothetical protein
MSVKALWPDRKVDVTHAGIALQCAQYSAAASRSQLNNNRNNQQTMKRRHVIPTAPRAVNQTLVCVLRLLCLRIGLCWLLLADCALL